jgi:23S rRNA pseudouridine1911/1915/1917 synthase
MRKAPKHSSGIVTFTVGKNDPRVLQDFIAAKLSISRRMAKAVIDGRETWVNRSCVWIAHHALKTGDSIDIPARVAKGAKGSLAAAKGEKRHIRVLWQDENYLAADKPSGVLSCGDDSSAEAILRNQESLPNLVAVHRLDRDTTGVMLFAKSHAAFLAAVEEFKTRKVSKTYHAIASGNVKFPRTTIDAPLDGERAVTRVERLSANEDASFLALKIETGRTNQIRRHLASVRHPVMGDRVFGRKVAADPRMMRVHRQMLHASTLELRNPLDPKNTIRVHSPLPADFRQTLALFDMGNRKK